MERSSEKALAWRRGRGDGINALCTQGVTLRGLPAFEAVEPWPKPLHLPGPQYPPL